MIKAKWKLSTHKYSKKGKNWLVDVLAANRGLTTSKKLNDFLSPNLNQITSTNISDVAKTVKRVEKAITNHEKMIVYSDYDADGISASAIVWETLNDLGAKIMPYIPHRIKEGYGLSTPAIKKHARNGVKLIITVDHGITAVEQVEEAKKLGVDIIITDHHVKDKILPKSFSIVHTTDLCGGGVAWLLCWEIIKKLKPNYKNKLLEKLELAAIATVADLVPLTGASRAIVKLGLIQLNKTTRPGLISLIKTAKINGKLTSFEIGHIIAPRINAMGRIEHGLDALRLLCSKNLRQSANLAGLLTKTNSKRQELTTGSVEKAFLMVEDTQLVGVLSDSSWHEGVIGLIASRLVEKHYRPMIIISTGDKYSKGSARSIPGFNIVSAIRDSDRYLEDAGGHPMAAGFTIKTKHITPFAKSINVYAQKNITQDMLNPVINIECELYSEDITYENYIALRQFEPFGVNNPVPIFLTTKLLVEEVRAVGKTSNHLKLVLSGINAIGFNMGERRYNLRPGTLVDAVYTLEEDKYNGAGKVQIKIKDLENRES